MTESYRQSALASRHKALGSGLEDWNGMGTAWSYNSNSESEHDAVRESAGLFDMSPLKKVMVRGEDALWVINHTITRDATRISPGHSSYTAVLTEQGTVADDAIVANNGNDEWMFCHGSGGSMELLQQSAQGKKVTISLDDDLHDIAVQGPQALSLLDASLNFDLSELSYFQHREGQIFGCPVRISRTGYSGERGYEIFAAAADVGTIWDQLLTEGAQNGVMPASFTALDKVRIEAGLLFYGYDMTDEHTPWEVGLGFTVNTQKEDYRGKQAALESKGNERFLQTGIIANHSDALVGGESIQLDGAEVGIINSPAWSHRLNQSLALGHIAPDAASAGTEVEIVGEDISVSGQVAALPFYDPNKARTHA